MKDRITASILFYPTLAFNVLLARILTVRNWWDIVDDYVVLGALPFKSDVRKLSDEGVGAVVNTCEEYPGPTEEYEKFGIAQLRVPTVDFTHPTLDSVERAVTFMEEQADAGNKIYVHCKAGRARSATVVVCWMIKRDQVTAKQAQQTLLKIRSHVNPRLPERPVVQQYEAKYLTASGAE